MNPTVIAILVGLFLSVGCGSRSGIIEPKSPSSEGQLDLDALEAELSELLGPRLPLPGQANDQAVDIGGVVVFGSSLPGLHADAILKITGQDREAAFDNTINEIWHLDRTHARTLRSGPSGSTEFRLSFSDGRWAIDGATHENTNDLRDDG